MSVSTDGDTPPQRSLNNTVPNTTMSSSKGSYAQVTQNVSFPKKEQAIVTDAVEGFTI